MNASFNPLDGIQFCWHCGANVSLQEEKRYCQKCRAPLDEEVRLKIFSRNESEGSTRCWLCNGTTSGDVCSICGSPLTKKGLDGLPKVQLDIQAKELIKTVAIYSPKDKDFKPIELSFEELEETVKQYVKVIEVHNSDSGPVYIIRRPEETNVTFEKLRNDPLIKEKNLKVIIRDEQINPQQKEIVLRFFYWKPEIGKDRYQFKSIMWNVGLLVVTFITVSIAGWQYAKSIYETYLFVGKPALDIFLYTFSLMTILILHEFGHYSISRLKNLDASLPYFIPVPPLPGGIQTLGTFGAMIRQKEPFTTRNDLFEIGIAGPVAGFIVTIPLFLIGLKLTYVVDAPLAQNPTNLAQIPIVLMEEFLIIIGQYTNFVPYFDPTMQTLAMHPMMLAGYVGFILTGLNLMPASQLDGGHTFRAVFGGMTHRIISLLVALLMILNPFTRIFGMLILLMSFMQHPGAIDDVSKVHWSKYIYISIAFIIGILCLPLPRIAYFQSLLGQ